MTFLSKYKTSFLVGMTMSMEYRFDFFMNLLSTVFPIIIQVFLWSAIYAGSSQDKLYGYSFFQMLIYTCLAGAVSKFVSTQVEEKINNDIYTGELAKYLTMPISYLVFRFTNTLGEKLFSMMILFLISGCLLLGFGISGMYKVSPIFLFMFIPSLILGMMLNFFLFTLISLSAFWFTEVGSFFHAISVIIMVISGGVFPIDVLGEGFRNFINFMPFLYTTGFSIQVITGSLTIEKIISGLFIQIIWIAILSILSQIVWKKGLKKYVAVGG